MGKKVIHMISYKLKTIRLEDEVKLPEGSVILGLTPGSYFDDEVSTEFPVMCQMIKYLEPGC